MHSGASGPAATIAPVAYGPAHGAGTSRDGFLDRRTGGSGVIRVVGSGFGRTGTMSTKRALEMLGFGRCYHMEEVIRRPAHARVWLEVAEGRPVDWHALFAGFGSTVDFPASVVWEDILAAFPDAKVLHTVRPADAWYDSTAETIARSYDHVVPWMRRIPVIARPFRMSNKLIWEDLFGGRFDDRAHAIEVYESWTQHVRDTVPADRLLVFDVAEGWEPLCEFLDVPVPDEPFPRVNDRVTMLRRLRTMRAVGYAIPVVAASGAGAALRRAQRRRGTRTSTATASITAP